MDTGPELKREAPSALGDEPSDAGLSELPLLGTELVVCGSELAGLCAELAGGAPGAVGVKGSLATELGGGEVSLGEGLGLPPALGSSLAGTEPPGSAGPAPEVSAPSAVPDAGAAASAASAPGVAPRAITAASAVAHSARRQATIGCE